MRPDAPSDTALLIARSILLSSRDPDLRGLVAPGEEEAVRRVLDRRACTGWFGFAMRRGWSRRLLVLLERRALGGIFAHYLARKRWIETELRRGLADGIRQAIILGAGCDALAWRLHGEFPEAVFFEIDHPATQALKRGLQGRGANLHFLPADLSRHSPLETLAAHPSFRADEPAFVIAEGLTMYFGREEVAELLRAAATIAGRRGRVLFTFMEEAADGSIRFRGEHPTVAWWLRWRREPFRWGCRRDALTDFLQPLGLETIAVTDHRDLEASVLRPRGLSHLALARGELLGLCSVAA